MDGRLRVSARSMVSRRAQLAPFPSIVEMLGRGQLSVNIRGRAYYWSSLEHSITDESHRAGVPSLHCLAVFDRMHICGVDNAMLSQSHEAGIDIRI